MSHYGLICISMITNISKTSWLPSHMHVRVLSRFSRVWLFVTPWTVARQAPPPVKFFRQEYCSGLPWPSPGDLTDSGTDPVSCVHCIGRQVLYHCTTWRPHIYMISYKWDSFYAGYFLSFIVFSYFSFLLADFTHLPFYPTSLSSPLTQVMLVRTRTLSLTFSFTKMLLFSTYFSASCFAWRTTLHKNGFKLTGLFRILSSDCIIFYDKDILWFIQQFSW